MSPNNIFPKIKKKTKGKKELSQIAHLMPVKILIPIFIIYYNI